MTGDGTFRWGRAFSWALHDLANTIYSAVVVTIYFPLFTTDAFGKQTPAGIAAVTSMVAAGLVVPVLGALVDSTGKAKAYLVRTVVAYSLLCLAMTGAALVPGIGMAWLTLALFVVANFLYQVSLVFYNALLPTVAPPGRQGRISGLGVGLGYLGQPLALPVAFLLAAKLSGAGLNGEGVTFAVAGVCVLLFSIPLFLWVPERRVARPAALTADLVGAEYRRLWERLRRLPGQRNIFLFLIGNFLCVDVLNTAIFWTAVYLARVAGLSRGDIIATLIAVNLCAFVAGCTLGWVTDRIGAKRTMVAAGLALLAVLPVLAAATNPWVVRIGLCTLGATGLSGIWVAGRKLLLDLVPEERAGEFFGLYGLTNKGAAFGQALFGILGDWIGMRLALGLITLPLVAGIVCISRVDPAGGLTGRTGE